MAEVRGVWPWDADLIVDGLSEEDVAELSAHEHDAYSAICLAIDRSAMAFAITLNGRPIAVFGALHHDTSPRTCTPWLIGTTDCASIGRLILRYAEPWLTEVLAKGCQSAWNVMHSRHLVHARWVQRLGFTLGQSFLVGEQAEEFRYIQRIM